VGGTIGNLVLSPYKKWLYCVNRTTDKLVQIDASTLKQTREWNMLDGGETFTPTRDGKSLYTFGYEKGQTVVVELDPIALTARKKFKLDLSPFDIAAADNGLLFLSGETGGWTDVAVVDAKKQSIVGRWGGVWNRSFIQLSADQSRVYASTQGVNPGKIEGFPIPVKLDEKPTPSVSPNAAENPLGGQFSLSPDGKFLIAQTGSMLRLGNNREDDLLAGAKLPPNLGAAFDVERGLMLLLAADGTTIKRYSYPAMQWQSNYRLGVLAHQMAYDGKSGRLYVGAIDPSSLGRVRARGFGDVHVYELKDLPVVK
jgi:hypothetical protein